MARKYSLFNVKIDPEFEALIEAPTEEEYNQLKENIREHGLLDRILVWREPGTDCDLIVDGHNRFRILNELSETGEFFIDDSCFQSVIFFNRDDAKEYMIKNQLGRRNLTREQKLKYIGMMQENRKQSRGGDRGNQYTVEAKGQNEPLPKSTAAQIAKEVGVSESTVKRAEKFSKGIDAIEEVSKDAAYKILKGKANVTDADIAKFPTMKPEEQNVFIESVFDPDKKQKYNSRSKVIDDRIPIQLPNEQLLLLAKEFMKTFFKPKNNGIIPFDQMMQMFDACADDYWQLAQTFEGEELGEVYKLRAIGLAQYAFLLNLFNYNDRVEKYEDRRWKFGYDHANNLHIIPPEEYANQQNG